MKTYFLATLLEGIATHKRLSVTVGHGALVIEMDNICGTFKTARVLTDKEISEKGEAWNKLKAKLPKGITERFLLEPIMDYAYTDRNPIDSICHLKHLKIMPFSIFVRSRGVDRSDLKLDTKSKTWDELGIKIIGCEHVYVDGNLPQICYVGTELLGNCFIRGSTGTLNFFDIGGNFSANLVGTKNTVSAAGIIHVGNVLSDSTLSSDGGVVFNGTIFGDRSKIITDGPVTIPEKFFNNLSRKERANLLGRIGTKQTVTTSGGLVVKEGEKPVWPITYWFMKHTSKSVLAKH